ncbi:MAG: DNA starvation/stationary phase protection protein [Schleiferiaceae bacterium]|jgi:starvation-inducible DNA-binding protein|nr:DNA starvation/stationary phase protection protein [Schleiferiaceae bacterium]
MNTNFLGLPIKQSKELSEMLNTLLSTYQIHYQNLRGLHWNIKGSNFFELHVKFEEYYNDAQEKIDMIAERILTLGEGPLHSFEDYIETSRINSAKNISNDNEAVDLIIKSVQEIVKLERPILHLAGEVSDDGTADLMTQFIAQQEKELWMLNAWINRQ